MSIGPLVQGSVRPIWSFTILQDDNTYFQLGGASFAGTLYNRLVSRNLTLTPAGFTITGSTTGTFTYTPATPDVAEAGEWELEIAITIAGNPTYVRDHVSIYERYAA